MIAQLLLFFCLFIFLLIVSHVTLSNLAIPDTFCSPNDDSMCPPDLVCKDIHLTMEQRGYGSFDNIGQLSKF